MKIMLKFKICMLCNISINICYEVNFCVIIVYGIYILFLFLLYYGVI